MSSNKRWTEEEDFDLRFYHAEGETYEQIAERLGRSAASVSQRLSGFKKDKKPSVAWTSDEERTLTEMCEQGKDDQAIAEQLGRTIYSVASRKRKLGLKNKRWTKGEEAEIMRLKGMELSWEEISLALNKTISSVQNRYEELISIAEETDIKRKKHKPEPYKGPSIAEISLEAERLGMSYGQYVAMQHQERSETW